MSYFTVAIVVVAVLYLALRLSRGADGSANEKADWFGTTGLSEDVERELPRYLRREFGEKFRDSSSLKAADLTYVGRFQEQDFPVHYWKVPYRDRQDVFAYVQEWPSGQTCTGWGDRQPPVSAPSA